MVVDRFPASPTRVRGTTVSRIPRPSARRSSRSGEEPNTPSRANTFASSRLSSRAMADTTTPTRSSALPSARRTSRSATDSKTPSRRGVPTPTRRQSTAAESGIPNPRLASGADSVVPRSNTTSRLRTPAKDRPDPSRLPTKSPRALPDRGTPTLSGVGPSPSRTPLQASPYARRTSTGGARNNVNRKLNMTDVNPRRASGASTNRLVAQKPRGSKTFLADRRDTSSATAGGTDSLTGMDAINARRESLKARRESLAARRESLAARREALKARKESLPDRRDPTSDRTEPSSARRESITARRDSLGARRDNLTARKDNLTARRDNLTARRDNLTARRDNLTARRDSLTARRDSLTARRDSLTARRDSLTARKESLTARRDNPDPHRDSLTARRDSLVARRENLAARRDSLTSRRDSSGRRISSGSARVQAGMTALESFRAARRASLQAQEAEDEQAEQAEQDEQENAIDLAPTQSEEKEEKPDRPCESITYPDRLDPIVPSSYPNRKGPTISERFDDSDINLENVERLRLSLGGRRSIGPNEEMPEEVPQLRRNSLESYMDDGRLRPDSPSYLSGLRRGIEKLHCSNDGVEQDYSYRRQRSPLRSIEANTDVPKATEWLSKRYSTGENLRRSSILVPDIDDEKAGWPTDDEDVEDLGAW